MAFLYKKSNNTINITLIKGIDISLPGVYSNKEKTPSKFQILNK